MLRIESALPAELDDIVTRVIGCCIEVHRALGPGLLESIVSRAVCLELEAAGMSFEREKLIAVVYRGQFLCFQRVDIVVASQIVLEIKCVERLNPVHHAQLLNYLRISKLKVGLLVNFNVAVLKDGLKRIVL